MLTNIITLELEDFSGTGKIVKITLKPTFAIFNESIMFHALGFLDNADGTWFTIQNKSKVTMLISLVNKFFAWQNKKGFGSRDYNVRVVDKRKGEEKSK
jgi:hypothetical protein